jgi:hypothetical protein
MQIQDIIKRTIIDHKDEVEKIQWAIMSGVSSLLYSEYIKNMKQKQTPIPVVLVPEIKTIKELLDENNSLMKTLSEHLIDDMYKDIMYLSYGKYKKSRYFELFKNENREILKTIFDVYIIPNMRSRIPETISKKFDLENPENSSIREDNTIDLFNRKSIDHDSNFYNYIVDESILQLVIYADDIEKDVIYLESVNNFHFEYDKYNILTVNSESAICPIHFYNWIWDNEDVMKILSFVTNTHIITKLGDDNCMNCTITENYDNNDNNDRYYTITSSPFNKVSIVKLGGLRE